MHFFRHSFRDRLWVVQFPSDIIRSIKTHRYSLSVHKYENVGTSTPDISSFLWRSRMSQAALNTRSVDQDGSQDKNRLEHDCYFISRNAATTSAIADKAIDGASLNDGTRPIGPRRRNNDASENPIWRSSSRRISCV